MEMLAIVVGDRRQFKFGTPLGKQVQPQNPLVNRIVPILHRQISRADLFRQQPRRRICRRRFNTPGRQCESAKFQQLCRLNALGRRIKLDVQIRLDVVGKQFAQPVRFKSPSPSERTVFISLSRDSISRISATTSSGLFCATLSRAKLARRADCGRGRSVMFPDPSAASRGFVQSARISAMPRPFTSRGCTSRPSLPKRCAGTVRATARLVLR